MIGTELPEASLSDRERRTVRLLVDLLAAELGDDLVAIWLEG